MRRIVGAIATALVWLASATAAAPAPSSSAGTVDIRAPLPEDPAVRRGVLPNGVRYAVMRASKPAGGLSLRLGIEVGSYEETDQERGVAHFIEHMAFRSTRAFPDNGIEATLKSRGVTIGRDVNAHTSLGATTFEVDLPTPTADDAELALRWLRNIADGVVFDPVGVDRERGVVMAEEEADKTPQNLAGEAFKAFVAPDLRSTSRNPIGTDAVLRTVTPEILKSFYDRWYRPEAAVVVLVGDRPLDDLEAMVKRTFATWQGSGPTPRPVPRGTVDSGRGTDANGINQPAVLNVVSICRPGPADPRGAQDIARIRRDALTDIWQEILNQRLADLRTSGDNGLIGAKMETEENDVDLRALCVEVTTASGAWAPALKAVQKELRRFQESGPTELEVETATDRVRSLLRGVISAAPNRSGGELARTLLERSLAHAQVIEPRQALHAYDIAVEDLTVGDIGAAFAGDWHGSGPLISVIMPGPPSREAVMAAWTADGAAPLKPYADRKVSEWAYAFGPAGTVGSRRMSALGGITEITFRNGVRLNFKQTDFAKGSVNLIVRFGEGRRALASADYQAAVLGGAMASLGGVGKHSFDDLRRIVQDGVANIQIHVGDDSFAIRGDISVDNLSDRLNVLTAFMSDPGFRSSADPAIREAVEAIFRLYRTTPQMIAGNALGRSIAPGSPFVLPDRAAFDGLNSEKLAAILKPAITQEPIEITLVGDLDEKTAIKLIGATFGALPARPTPNLARADTIYLRFPATLPAPIHTTHEGSTDKAVTEAIWPLYVATPARRREEYAIRLLAAVFNDELYHQVRQTLGKSYDPTVSAQTPDDSDQGQLVAVVESYPADVDAVLTQIRAAAAALRDGRITAEQLEAARAPILTRVRQSLMTNASWALGAAELSRTDQPLRDILEFSDVFASLRLDDVRGAAATWLASAPLVVIVTPEPTATGTKP